MHMDPVPSSAASGKATTGTWVEANAAARSNKAIHKKGLRHLRACTHDRLHIQFCTVDVGNTHDNADDTSPGTGLDLHTHTAT